MFYKRKLINISRLLVIPFLIIFIITIQPLFSQQSEMDLSFGVNGVFSTALGDGSGPRIRSGISSCVLQQDGKIIVTGYTGANSTDFLIIRITSKGTLDSTFGTNGIVITDFLQGNDAASDVSLQQDGKIVVVGHATNQGLYQEMAIARYNVDGSLDTTFSTDGKSNSYIYNFKDRVFGIGVHILPNSNKILVTGHFGGNAVLFRYNPNGTLDNTFNYNGKKVFSASNYRNGKIYCSSIQPDGKILIAGVQFPGTGAPGDFYIVKVKENGTKDSSFANNGDYVLDLNNNEDYTHSLLTLNDGSILMGGASGGKFTLVKLNSVGKIDLNYGIKGILSTPLSSFGYDDVKSSMALQTGDSILIGGYSGPYSLMRVTPGGAIDSNFSMDGFMKSNVKKGTPGKIIIQPDGKIIQIGNSDDGSDTIFVLRYCPSLVVNTIEDYTLSGIKLLPNPTKEHLQLQYFLSQDERVTLKLYNIQGKMVSNILESSFRYSGENKEMINLSEFQNGVYILLINYSKNVYATKIIKI